MIYDGDETKPLLADVGLKFERAEMQMDLWRFHERVVKKLVG